MRKRNWKKLSSKIVYKNPWIKVREDCVIQPDGKKTIYGILEKVPACSIIALDKNDSIYLIKEFRYPIEREVFGLPGGCINKKNLLSDSKKELYQETGVKAKKWTKLGSYFVAPGHEVTKVYVMLAENLDTSKVKISNQENDELIRQIIKVKIDKVKEMIGKGEIKDGTPLASLNLFFQNRS